MNKNVSFSILTSLLEIVIAILRLCIYIGKNMTGINTVAAEFTKAKELIVTLKNDLDAQKATSANQAAQIEALQTEAADKQTKIDNLNAELANVQLPPDAEAALAELNAVENSINPAPVEEPVAA